MGGYKQCMIINTIFIFDAEKAGVIVCLLLLQASPVDRNSWSLGSYGSGKNLTISCCRNNNDTYMY